MVLIMVLEVVTGLCTGLVGIRSEVACSAARDAAAAIAMRRSHSWWLLGCLLTSSVAFVQLRALHGPPARSRVTARALEPVAEERSLSESETDSLFAVAVASNADGLLSFGDFKRIAEYSQMLDEGELAEDELVEMWARVPKGAGNKLDARGFGDLVGAIDELFDFVDVDDEGAVETSSAPASEAAEAANADVGDDAQFRVMFDRVASEGSASLSDVSSTPYVAELLKDGARCDANLTTREEGEGNARAPRPNTRTRARTGDITSDELDAMWAGLPKAAPDRVSVAGFLELRGQIEDLFEDEPDEVTSVAPVVVPASAPEVRSTEPDSMPDLALARPAPSGVVVGRLLDAIAAAGSTKGGVDASSTDVLAVALAAEAVVKDPSSPCVLRSATSVTEIEVRSNAPRAPGVD